MIFVKYIPKYMFLCKKIIDDVEMLYIASDVWLEAIHFALLRRKFTINEKGNEIRNIFCVFALGIMSRFQTRCVLSDLL